MKQDIAILWADALESGNYIQGHNYLNHDNAFCCLGVLSDIACDLGIVYKTERQGSGGNAYTAYNQEGFGLTTAIKNWAGIQSLSGDVFSANSESFMHMNDEDGLTFAQIAEVIRKDWASL